MAEQESAIRKAKRAAAKKLEGLAEAATRGKHEYPLRSRSDQQKD